MLGQEPKHRVTLLVIKKAGKTTTGDMEAIFEAGKAHLTKNGLPEDRIETRMIEGGRVRTRILETAQEGLYAAVAVGRTGAGQGLMQRILMGSVSTALFRDLERTALWFCY
jgi:nucleotide-binding universal stress UspA family protein